METKRCCGNCVAPVEFLCIRTPILYYLLLLSIQQEFYQAQTSYEWEPMQSAQMWYREREGIIQYWLQYIDKKRLWLITLVTYLEGLSISLTFWSNIFCEDLTTHFYLQVALMLFVHYNPNSFFFSIKTKNINLKQKFNLDFCQKYQQKRLLTVMSWTCFT